jgi:hypothetical protein
MSPESWFRRAVALLGLACTGCFGLVVEKPWYVEAAHPQPMSVKKRLGGDGDWDRRACQSSPALAPPRDKQAFLAQWGEPKERITAAQGEEWRYEEGGRWCGVWILFVVPIPAMLPVCRTSDHIRFRGDVAVAASSSRMDTAGAGLFVAFPYFPLFPFAFGPAGATQAREPIPLIVGPDARVDSCMPHFGPRPETPMTTEPRTDGAELVNCVSRGERKWAYRPDCD